MKKSVSTYRYFLLFALIFTMLGAVCYSPIFKADSKTIAKKEIEKSTTEHFLTIDHHVFSPLSFSFDSNTAYISELFEFVPFGLPFEIEHPVASAIFQSSYLNNIFPFSISAQAP